jgi:hypothetical protein
MDEKWFDDQLNECFEKGLSPNQFGRLMYHAGCAAQSEADREAVKVAMADWSSVYCIADAALAAAAIVEKK